MTANVHSLCSHKLICLSSTRKMGRPSIKNRRVKRKRQKKLRSNSDRLKTVCDSAVAGECNTCTSPLLFSDGSPSTLGNDLTSTHGDSKENDCSTSSALGDADIDLIEMELYDLYREEDGQPHTLEYLQKCNGKLRAKVKDDKIMINRLQRLNMKIKADKKDELERIRCFYEAIAFGQSRAGKMVRTALGTSTRAQNINKEMRELYSVDQDCNFE